MFSPCLLALVLAAEPSVVVESGKDPARVTVRAVLPPRLLEGLRAGPLTASQGEARLRLVLVDGGKPGPAILGRYEREGDAITFAPRHPLGTGERYRAVLDLGDRRLTADHAVPVKPAARPARVETVYPTATELPANQLKFYVRFSRPMRESRSIFDHIEIRDDKGKPVPDPWRRTELWSADGRRLTLWIHPGRIKSGVNLRDELGPVLEPGRAYSLILGKGLRDEDGLPLEKEHVKKFQTTKPARGVVDVEGWKVRPPRAGTRQALTLRFPAPLDHALLQRFVSVLDDKGRPVKGRIEVGEEERSVSFVPEASWRAGRHQVAVDGRLEDLAGNTPEQPFDVDREAPSPGTPKLTLAFQPAEE